MSLYIYGRSDSFLNKWKCEGKTLITILLWILIILFISRIWFESLFLCIASHCCYILIYSRYSGKIVKIPSGGYNKWCESYRNVSYIVHYCNNYVPQSESPLCIPIDHIISFLCYSHLQIPQRNKRNSTIELHVKIRSDTSNNKNKFLTRSVKKC